ncbi:hypothetical protein HFN60_18360 [Rhizobium leguminosarum]|uniref:protein-lysine N-methyltransferase n=1 Tax=Rhizobium leguminosarum TaxID=384 RepID=UPI001C964C17|nr:protein-lysine N-methyltransferase [Rhizobium leguminosarum]MBY5817584.1 hypothetical protein [Rhizobium leguminosarum]
MTVPYKNIRIIDGYLQGNIFPGMPDIHNPDFEILFHNPLSIDGGPTNSKPDLDFNIALSDYDKRHREKQFSRSFQEELIIDFDWRFSNYTLRMYETVLSGRSKVLFIGAPTLYFFFKRLHSFDSFLFDINDSYLAQKDGGNIIVGDIRSIYASDLRGTFDAVVIDPPWYPADIALWTQIGLSFLAANGLLVSTVFPPTVRPGADTELSNYLNVFRPLFAKTSYFISVYNSPSFEAEVFRGSGVSYLDNWRRGLTFMFENPISIPDIKNIDLSFYAGPKVNWRRTVSSNGNVFAEKEGAEKSRLVYKFYDTISTRHPLWGVIETMDSRNWAGIDAG